MAKFSRKIKRAKLLGNRRRNKKIVNNVKRSFDNIPSACTFCNINFDLVRDADTWNVECFENQLPNLMCPECYETRKKDAHSWRSIGSPIWWWRQGKKLKTLYFLELKVLNRLGLYLDQKIKVFLINKMIFIPAQKDNMENYHPATCMPRLVLLLS